MELVSSHSRITFWSSICVVSIVISTPTVSAVLRQPFAALISCCNMETSSLRIFKNALPGSTVPFLLDNSASLHRIVSQVGTHRLPRLSRRGECSLSFDGHTLILESHAVNNPDTLVSVNQV